MNKRLNEYLSNAFLWRVLIYNDMVVIYTWFAIIIIVVVVVVTVATADVAAIIILLFYLPEYL